MWSKSFNQRLLKVTTHLPNQHSHILFCSLWILTSHCNPKRYLVVFSILLVIYCGFWDFALEVTIFANIHGKRPKLSSGRISIIKNTITCKKSALYTQNSPTDPLSYWSQPLCTVWVHGKSRDRSIVEKTAFWKEKKGIRKENMVKYIKKEGNREKRRLYT